MWFTRFVANMSKTQFKRVCMHFLQMKMYSSAVWQFFWLCCCKEIGCSTKRRTICVVILDEREYNLIQRKTEQRDPTKQASQQMQVLLHDLKKHYPNLWQANKQIKVSPCKYDGKEKRPMLGSVKFTPTCFNGLKRMVWGWFFIVNLLNQCVIVIGLFWLLLYVGLGQ